MFFSSIGISPNAFGYARNAAKKGVCGFCLNDYEYCYDYGIIRLSDLNLICVSAQLNKYDYILNEKIDMDQNPYSQQVPEQNPVISDSAIDKLIEVLQIMGRTQAQSMEYLLEIRNGIDLLNEKWS